MRIILTITFTAVVVFTLLLTRSDSYSELKELPPPAVAVEAVAKLSVQPVNKVTGKLKPSRAATIQFQVSGQIISKDVEAGENVTTGMVLLSIEDGDYADAVQESWALVKIEQNAIERDSRLLTLMAQEAELQQQEVDRLEKLGKDSLASRSLYDQSLQELYSLQSEEARLKHSLESSRVQLMIEEARLNKAERNLQRASLIAPFDGVVNNISVDVGDYVSPGQPVLELIQVDSLDLNIEVTGRVATELYLGQSIKVETSEDERQGEIIALAVDPDPSTNTHTLKIRIPSEGLFPGELAVAFLPGQQYENVNVLPLSSILYEEGKTYVFQVQNETLKRIPIKLVERYHDLQIIEGVDAGTQIVSRDVSSLADGQTVNIH